MPSPHNPEFVDDAATNDRGSPRHDVSLPQVNVNWMRVVRRFVGVLRRRYRLAAFSMAVTLLPIASYALLAIPEFSARGSIQVAQKSGFMAGNPLTDLLGGTSQSEVHTEVEILRSRGLLVRALKKLALQLEDPQESSVISLNLGIAWGKVPPIRPEVSSVRTAIQHTELHEDAYAPLEIRLGTSEPNRIWVEANGERAEGNVGELIELTDLKMTFRELPKLDGESITVEVLPDSELYVKYKDKVSIAALGSLRDPTSVVGVTARAATRNLAKSIVGQIMELYIEQSLSWQRESASQTAKFIEQQLENIREELTHSENALRDFASENNAVQLDTQARVAIQNAAELEVSKIRLQIQEQTIGTVLKRLRAGRNVSARMTSNYFDDAILAAAVATLTEREIAYETSRAALTDQHPTVRNAARSLDLQRVEVRKLLRSSLTTIKNQREQVEFQINESRASLTGIPEKEMELGRLVRKTEVSQRLYTMLLEKHEEAAIVEAATTTSRRVIDVPSTRYKAAKPKRARLLILALLLSLIFGSLSVLVAETLNRRLDTVASITATIDAPVYGTIPLCDVNASGKHLSPYDVWPAKVPTLIESFRSLAVTTALVPHASRRALSIAVTSAQPGEGKSTVASNLAVALASSNKKTLMIDTDLRKAVQHRVWKCSRAMGLTDILADSETSSTVKSAAPASMDGMPCPDLLVAGTRVPDALAVLSSADFVSRLEDWRAEYDYIIFDCPPAFVAETPMVVSQSDLTLIVARPTVVEKSNLLLAINRISKASSTTGLVLNSVAPHHLEYGYGGSNYYYAAEYSDDAPADGIESKEETLS